MGNGEINDCILLLSLQQCTIFSMKQQIVSHAMKRSGKIVKSRFHVSLSHDGTILKKIFIVFPVKSIEPMCVFQAENQVRCISHLSLSRASR